MIRIETRRGDPVLHGGRRIVPVSRAVELLLPGRAGGLVWNRPLGVLVEGAGEPRFLPIWDRTRYVQWLLIGGGLLAALLSPGARRRLRIRRRA